MIPIDVISKAKSSGESLRLSYDIVFWLNAVLSASFIVLARGFIFFDTAAGYVPKTAFKYYFFRAGDRLVAVLHLHSAGSVGKELVLVISITCITTIFLAISRLVHWDRQEHSFLYRLSGFVALLAFPTAWSYAAHLAFEASGSDYHASFWSTPLGIILPVDGIAIFLLLAIAKTQVKICRFIFAIHYITWFWIIGATWITVAHAFWPRLITPFVLSISFPVAGLLWLVHYRNSISTSPDSSQAPHKLQQAGVASVCALLLLVLWLPPMSGSISYARDISSLAITMTRGSCFGACPIYTITIRGDGRVEYNGKQQVVVAGMRTSTVSSDQVKELLLQLNRIKFFALDENAFERCHDTPTVVITVSLDGRSKTVRSDSYCVGTPTGPQAQLVNLSRQIDKIVNSDQWVRATNSSSSR